MALIAHNNGIFSIDASHLNMARFGSKNSPDHINDQRRIIKLVRDASAVMSKLLAEPGRLDFDVKRLEPATVDRRLSRAPRVFPKDVENLAPITGLSGDDMIVLTNVRKITALSVLKSESKPPEQFHIPGEHGDFKNRNSPDEPDEPDAPGDEGPTEFKSIEQVVAYLKPDSVTQIFGTVVTKTFMRAHRVLGIEAEPKSTRDFIISPASTGDTDHSWPIRFASGKTDITFPIGCRWSLVNEAKAWIEDLVQEPINWWPLRPRIHPLPAGYVRVNWKCVSPAPPKNFLIVF